MDEKIAVVGCGLTGSHIPYPLGAVMKAAEWKTNVLFIDFDEIAPRNSPSTLPMDQVGRNKADFVSRRADEHGVNTSWESVKLVVKNLDEVLGLPGLIVGAVDNDETRLLLWSYSDGAFVPYIDIGVNDFNGRVSWKAGGQDTHPFSPGLSQLLPEDEEEEKTPPCMLYATRKTAVLAVELAVQSISTFWRGHDPHEVVYELTGSKAERGDMVGWSIISSPSNISASPNYAGRYEW